MTTPPQPLLIGSANRKKAGELELLLEGLPWDVRSLADYPSVAEPIEDGATFEANALIKARYYGRVHGVVCVADDSGLVVDAIGGAPGVYSARYAGEDGNDAANIRKLLGALVDVEPARRTARFVCCAAIVFPDGTAHVEHGEVEGVIAPECRGVNGFGYDPLFIPEGYERTFGELPPEVKHGISHRGRAFRKLRTYLESVAL